MTTCLDDAVIWSPTGLSGCKLLPFLLTDFRYKQNKMTVHEPNTSTKLPASDEACDRPKGRLHGWPPTGVKPCQAQKRDNHGDGSVTTSKGIHTYTVASVAAVTLGECIVITFVNVHFLHNP